MSKSAGPTPQKKLSPPLQTDLIPAKRVRKFPEGTTPRGPETDMSTNIDFNNK